MKLYLVRHGQAADAINDDKRLLSLQGQQDVAKLANFLKVNDVNVARIYHSEKERAQQTALILAAALKPSPHVECIDGLQPQAPISTIIEYSNYWSSDVMLVGHLPYMARLAAVLLTGTECCINFETAAIICLERISRTQWCLNWFLNPRLLHFE